MNQSESQTLVTQRSLYILYIRFSSSTVDNEFRLYTYYYSNPRVGMCAAGRGAHHSRAKASHSVRFVRRPFDEFLNEGTSSPDLRSILEECYSWSAQDSVYYSVIQLSSAASPHY